MNILLAARERADCPRFAARNVVDIRFRPTALATPHVRTSPTARGLLQARWILDPATGRLQCVWETEDEATDSRSARSDARRRSGDANLRPEAIAA